MSTTSNTGHMKPLKPAVGVLVFLALLMVACWALIIWMAVVVSETLLNMLGYIVDLAAMTP